MRNPLAATGSLAERVLMPLAFASAPAPPPMSGIEALMDDSSMADASGAAVLELRSEGEEAPSSEVSEATPSVNVGPDGSGRSKDTGANAEQHDVPSTRVESSEDFAQDVTGHANDTVDPSSTSPAESLDTSMAPGHRIDHLSNGIRGNANSDSSLLGNATTVSPSSAQRASAKVANLRAAFEKRETNGSSSRISPTSQTSSPKQGSVKPDSDTSVGDVMAKLQENLNVEMALRASLEERCRTLESQVQDLRARLESQRQSKENLDHSKSGHTRTLSDHQISARQQLTALKRSISVATRLDDQLTDTALTQHLGTLYHELQNWTVHNFRRAKLQTSSDALEKVRNLQSFQQDKSGSLLGLEASITNADSGHKLAVLQTTAMGLIMEVFSDPLLFGLPSENNRWHASLLQSLEGLTAVLPAPALNRWRATTLDVLRQTPESVESINLASSQLTETICSVLNALTDLGEQGFESRRSSLMAIVSRFVSLAHAIQVQRARYIFTLPNPQSPFVPSEMEDISGADDTERGVESKILCATFPTVVKIGDELGNNEHFHNVIIKAKVVCKHP